MISIRHVYQTFGSRQILKDVSLTVKDGETMVILGASGSGKSTLLKLIIGLLKPTSGEVMVNGKDMARLSEAELNHERRHMGFVFQYSALFDSMTVKENVAFGLRMHTKMSEEEIERIVKEKGGTSIRLHAQCRVTPFYGQQGYEEYGVIEDDEGCPHIWMKKQL